MDSAPGTHLGLAWRSMFETWLMSIMKALCGTLWASVVTIRVNILSVRPTVASAAGTKDLRIPQMLARQQGLWIRGTLKQTEEQ